MSGARAEAQVLARYLLGRDAVAEAVQLYERACADEGDAPEDERRVLRFALARPWSIAALDGALALVRPHALLRRRVLLMTAILEARPDYCAEFLPARRSGWYALAIAWVALRAAVQTCAGLALLRLVR
jgi:hypothetical protein